MPCFFSRYLNFCFYKDIGTRCSRTDDIASFFNHQRLADDIIKTKFLNRNTKLHAGAIPYICTTSSETIVPVFVISSTASSVISASRQSRRSSIDSDDPKKESFYHSSIPLLSIYEKNLTPYESIPFISFHIFVYEIFSARKSVIICSVSSNPLAS